MSEQIQTKNVPWRSQAEGFQSALVYMQGRMKGEIKSIRTPWTRFNDATTDGIEWHSTTIIGARPGNGKTLIKDQIIREAFMLNPGGEFRVLEFQFEMLARTSAIREYSSILSRPYKYLCSAGDKIKEVDIDRCYEYAKERVKYPIDVVETPCTVEELKAIIHSYMTMHSIRNDGKVEYRKVIVTLDHSILLKKGKNEKDKFDTLYSLGEAVTELKRIYPIAFIILSQLNRDIDRPERNEPGKYGNYPLESDLFGADALLQHADTVVLLNRPGKQKIDIYGPDRYIIKDDKVLVMHFVKCRNGDTRLSFFRAEFESMRVSETDPPPIQERRIRV